MTSSHTSREIKRRRREQRKAALAAIAKLSDDDLRNLLHELGREINQQANVMNEIRSRLDAVRSEIERRNTLTSAGIHISDHAVLRFLERYRGIDTKHVREEIAAMAKRSGKLGSGEQYARRRDGETGITMGINEITNIVTTVFTEDEGAVMDIAK